MTISFQRNLMMIFSPYSFSPPRFIVLWTDAEVIQEHTPCSIFLSLPKLPSSSLFQSSVWTCEREHLKDWAHGSLTHFSCPGFVLISPIRSLPCQGKPSGKSLWRVISLWSSYVLFHAHACHYVHPPHYIIRRLKFEGKKIVCIMFIVMSVLSNYISQTKHTLYHNIP